MTNGFEQLKDMVLAEVLRVPAGGVKPRDLEQKLAADHGFSAFTVREAVKNLVAEGELVYTYRDPCNYVELAPVTPHHAARPMEVVLDARGNPWICDAGSIPSPELTGESCWSCGEVPFTRDD